MLSFNFGGFFSQIVPSSSGAIQKGQSKLPLSPCASAVFKIAVFLSHNKIKSRIISVSCFLTQRSCKSPCLWFKFRTRRMMCRMRSFALNAASRSVGKTSQTANCWDLQAAQAHWCFEFLACSDLMA